MFGSISEFDPKTDKYELWEEKFKFFLLVNGLKDYAKKPYLLSMVGMTGLGYYYDLNLPTARDDNGFTFKKLMDLLRAHFGSKTTQLAARHGFSHLSEKETDTVDDFAAALSRASV